MLKKWNNKAYCEVEKKLIFLRIFLEVKKKPLPLQRNTTNEVIK
jgi:hypothetical protein